MNAKLALLFVAAPLLAAGCESRQSGYAPQSEVATTEALLPPATGAAAADRNAMPEEGIREMKEGEAAAAVAPSKKKRKMAMRGAGAPGPPGVLGGLAAKPSAVMPSPFETDDSALDPSDELSNTDAPSHRINPMTNAAEDRFSTFAIDVDTAAYTIARRTLQAGQRPPAASVRVEEFINYFRYDYPNPQSEFGVNLEAAPSPFSSDGKRDLIRIGVQGKRITSKERKPTHLTFLVDVSGSMNRPDKLPLAVKALKILTANLQKGDTVGIVTYAGYVQEVLKPTGMSHRGRIVEALDSLGAGGGTGMSSGMELAYKSAISQHKPGHVSRVIVLSDGDANIGATSPRQILDKIKGYTDEGVTLSTIGLGMGNYKDSMMEQLANKGNGNYYYIDTVAEARKVFGEQMDGTLQVIAKDVKIQVEFDPEKIPQYRLIGYENRAIADKDFRNDKVDAGEIGAGHSVTALYEVVRTPGADGKLATVRVRFKQPDGFKARELAFDLTDKDFRDKVGDASQDFQFAASVAAFAEVLRGSQYAEGIGYAWIKEIAKSATRSQEDRREFIELVDRASKLASGAPAIPAAKTPRDDIPRAFVAGSYVARKISGGGLVGATVKLQMRRDGKLTGTFKGKREGKGFSIPFIGTVSPKGSISARGRRGANAVMVRGRAMKSGGAMGMLSGSINRKAYKVGFHAK